MRFGLKVAHLDESEVSELEQLVEQGIIRLVEKDPSEPFWYYTVPRMLSSEKLPRWLLDELSRWRRKMVGLEFDMGWGDTREQSEAVLELDTAGKIDCIEADDFYSRYEVLDEESVSSFPGWLQERINRSLEPWRY